MLSEKCLPFCLGLNVLTHWSRITYISIDNLTINGSDDGLLPGQHQTIIWTNACLFGPLEQISVKFYQNQNIFIKEDAFENVL